MNTILPGFEGQVQGFGDHIASGRLLFDSVRDGWDAAPPRCVPHEVFDSIHRIATGRREAPADLRAKAQAILIALGIDEGILNNAAVQRSRGFCDKQLSDAGTTAIAQLTADKQALARAALDAVTTRFAASAAAAAEQVEEDAAAFVIARRAGGRAGRWRCQASRSPPPCRDPLPSICRRESYSRLTGASAITR